MGSYSYLINKDLKICCEAYKEGLGGVDFAVVESSKSLIIFLDFCRDKNLKIECKSEYWINDQKEDYTDITDYKK
tara:strand:- start:662 stop:886 length:225 start_codon:yes stop_codon:yes gene_type:complete